MNSVCAISFEGSKQPAKKERKYANKGFIRASYAASLVATPASIIPNYIMKGMKKVSDLNPQDTVQFRKATQKALKDTGLYEKGVRVFHMEDAAMPTAKEMLSNLTGNIENLEKNFETMSKNPLSMIDSFLPVKYSRKDRKALEALRTEIEALSEKTVGRVTKQMEKFYKTAGIEGGEEQLANLTKGLKEGLGVGAKTMGMTFKTGKNACYLPHANKIITPEKALQTSVFHEMGHAMNHNGGFLMKALQKARPMAKTVPAIILTMALLNKRKTTDEKSDSKVQNFFDGVKRNAGKLTFISMLPMIAEETIASVRGGMAAEKLAKTGDLSKAVLNRVRLTNLGSFASYMTAGLVAAGSAALAVKIKDNIQAKYEAKKDAKYDARDAKIEAKRQAKEAKKSNKAE